MPDSVESRLARLEVNMDNVREDVRGLVDLLERRDSAATDERRSVKVALIALTGVILAALIAAVATVLAAGLIP